MVVHRRVVNVSPEAISLQPEDVGGGPSDIRALHRPHRGSGAHDADDTGPGAFALPYTNHLALYGI